MKRREGGTSVWWVESDVPVIDSVIYKINNRDDGKIPTFSRREATVLRRFMNERLRPQLVVTLPDLQTSNDKQSVEILCRVGWTCCAPGFRQRHKVPRGEGGPRPLRETEPFCVSENCLKSSSGLSFSRALLSRSARKVWEHAVVRRECVMKCEHLERIYARSNFCSYDELVAVLEIAALFVHPTLDTQKFRAMVEYMMRVLPLRVLNGLLVDCRYHSMPSLVGLAIRIPMEQRKKEPRQEKRQEQQRDEPKDS